jgi:hypothetical protein
MVNILVCHHRPQHQIGTRRSNLGQTIASADHLIGIGQVELKYHPIAGGPQDGIV